MSLRKIVRCICSRAVPAAVLSALLAAFLVSTAGAQETLEHRIKNKVQPSYPEIARKMNLAGVVKIEVTVSPNGTVKDTKVIGGNPILVNAAMDAVKKWRFETASDETVGVLEFKFDPSVN